MDALDATVRDLRSEQVPHRPPPPTPAAFMPPPAEAWQAYRDEWAAACAAADARLAEAIRAGHEDSWWEDDIDGH